MKVRSVLLPVVLLLSLAASGFLVARLHRVTGQQRQGFTLYITQTMYPAEGSKPILIASSIRYQKSDGSWRKDSTYLNGKKGTVFGQAGRGVFHVNEENKTLDYAGNVSTHVPTEYELRSSGGFVREETILGLKTFLIHSESSDHYICPALQGYPMKAVEIGKTGNVVFEVTRVVFGDPPEEFFASLPNYPVDTEKIKH